MTFFDDSTQSKQNACMEGSKVECGSEGKRKKQNKIQGSKSVFMFMYIVVDENWLVVKEDFL